MSNSFLSPEPGLNGGTDAPLTPADRPFGLAARASGGSEPRCAVVIGGGTMGAGIVSVLARAGLRVELVEVDSRTAADGRTRAVRAIDDGVARGRVTPDQAGAATARISAVVGVKNASARPLLALEAVPERLELKHALLLAAEDLEPDVLASNTSGLSIDRLAQPLRDPSRFLGLHFFNPVPAMELVEVIIGARTSAKTRRAAEDLVEAIGKQAVVVGDSPGFATSRLGLALGLEAIRMVESGVASAADIDKAMELGYRHPVGPLRLTDLVGLDVRLDIARNLQESYGERFAPPPLLEQMVDQGKLGKKSGSGFYEWEGD